MPFGPFEIVMLAVLALLIFFMFRNSRKRQAQARELQSQVVAGAEVMTNFGVYGTILSIDDEENKVLLETVPGTILTVHRQTIARVVTPTEFEEAEEAAGVTAATDSDPEFGERLAADSDPTPESKKSDD